jgi:hypothetical protein
MRRAPASRCSWLRSGWGQAARTGRLLLQFTRKLALELGALLGQGHRLLRVILLAAVALRQFGQRHFDLFAVHLDLVGWFRLVFSASRALPRQFPRYLRRLRSRPLRVRLPLRLGPPSVLRPVRTQPRRLRPLRFPLQFLRLSNPLTRARQRLPFPASPLQS